VACAGDLEHEQPSGFQKVLDRPRIDPIVLVRRVRPGSDDQQEHHGRSNDRETIAKGGVRPHSRILVHGSSAGPDTSKREGCHAMNRDELNRKSLEFFENLWRAGDTWELETSAYEQRRYDRLVEVIRDRRYPRVLEIGCGAGAFTGRLASLAD